MSGTGCRNDDGAVGSGVVLSNPAPNVVFKSYMADRPAQTSRLRAAEIALDVSIEVAHPVRNVWPIFKNFDAWMNRYGYVWDAVPADKEDAYVHLSSRRESSDLSGSDEPPTKYIVRKVIPERLIYLDSLPLPIVGKDGVWTGHNCLSLYEDGGRTKIVIFMEHTWYSETMSIEQLRAEAKGALESGFGFWRDYFIPDLISAVESRSVTPQVNSIQ